jgi:hypothetical protein
MADAALAQTAEGRQHVYVQYQTYRPSEVTIVVTDGPFPRSKYRMKSCYHLGAAHRPRLCASALLICPVVNSRHHRRDRGHQSRVSTEVNSSAAIPY